MLCRRSRFAQARGGSFGAGRARRSGPVRYLGIEAAKVTAA